MESKQLIWVGMAVGSFVGGLLPMFWGAGEFTFSSIIFSAIGGFLGIWIAFKMTH